MTGQTRSKMYRSKTDGSMRAYRRVTIEGKAVEQPTFGGQWKIEMHRKRERKKMKGHQARPGN